MEIKIVVACFKKDIHLARICVASVRYWYPEIDIYLLKDLNQGDFSTREIELNFNCKVFKTKRKKFGWPWSKLEVIFNEEKALWFFIDSDIVFVGRVLGNFAEIDHGTFCVTGEKIPFESDPEIEANYLNIDVVRSRINKYYSYPGFVFNGGQLLISSGILKEQDFSDVISFNPLIENKFPEIFKHGDQGILNYKLAAFHKEKKINLIYLDFWAWPNTPLAKSFTLSDIKNKISRPYLIHWAGVKPVEFSKTPHYDILSFYENQYYKGISYRILKKSIRKFKMKFISLLKISKYKMLGLKYT